VAVAAALLIASKKIQAFWGELRDGCPRLTTARRICRSLDEGMAGSARASKLALLLGVGLTTLLRWRRQFAGDGDGIDQH
jgi:putative transposase